MGEVYNTTGPIRNKVHGLQGHFEGYIYPAAGATEWDDVVEYGHCGYSVPPETPSSPPVPMLILNTT